MKTQKGFTLIEIIVVVAILGILTTLTLSNLGNARSKSRDAKRKADMKSIQGSLEAFYADENIYPASASWKTDLAPNYIPAIPDDPTNTGAFAYVVGIYTRVCDTVVNPSCDATQGYFLEINLENQNDPDGYTSGAFRKYKVCGGNNGTAANCAK